MPRRAVRVLVIGYGNPLCGDDGWGVLVAKALEPFERADVRVLICRQLTPELAADLAETRLVVFVDAAADRSPGELCYARLQADPASRGSAPPAPLVTHHMAATGLLRLCEDLYQYCPRAVMCAAGGYSFDIGAQMSPVLERVATKAQHRLIRLIERAGESRDH